MTFSKYFPKILWCSGVNPLNMKAQNTTHPVKWKGYENIRFLAWGCKAFDTDMPPFLHSSDLASSPWGRISKWDFVDLAVVYASVCVGLQWLCHCYEDASKQPTDGRTACVIKCEFAFWHTKHVGYRGIFWCYCLINNSLYVVFKLN